MSKGNTTNSNKLVRRADGRVGHNDLDWGSSQACEVIGEPLKGFYIHEGLSLNLGLKQGLVNKQAATIQ